MLTVAPPAAPDDDALERETAAIRRQVRVDRAHCALTYHLSQRV